MSRIDLSLECVEVVLDERTIKFYPLNFKAIRTVNKELESLRNTADGDNDNRLFAICRILEVAANRKGQQTTADELAELLDPGTSNAIMTELNRVSGFRTKAIAVDSDSAEDGVPRPTKASIGTESTPE